MQPPERQLERDIVRYLDGELGEAERRELVDRLRRDAAARRMLEQYATVDRLAGEALLDLLDRPRAKPAPARAAWARSRMIYRLLRPAAAVAAVVVLAVLIRPNLKDGPAPIGGDGPMAASRQAGQPAEAQLWDFPSRPLDVRLGPPADFKGGLGQRQVNRHVFGVLDEKASEVYVLEVDQIQTQARRAEWDF